MFIQPHQYKWDGQNTRNGSLFNTVQLNNNTKCSLHSHHTGEPTCLRHSLNIITFMKKDLL